MADGSVVIKPVFYNITTFDFDVFLRGELRHKAQFKVKNINVSEITAPILYPKVRLVHHARSGQSKCLIWAGGQSRESLCHPPMRHNFSNLNHDKISAVIREPSFKVKTPFKTLKFLSLLLPIFFLNLHFTFLSTLIIEGFVLNYVAPSKVCCEFWTATRAPNERDLRFMKFVLIPSHSSYAACSHLYRVIQNSTSWVPKTPDNG